MVIGDIITNQPLGFRVVTSRTSWIMRIEKRDFYTYVHPKNAFNIFIQIERDSELKKHIEERKKWLEFKEKIVEV